MQKRYLMSPNIENKCNSRRKKVCLICAGYENSNKRKQEIKKKKKNFFVLSLGVSPQDYAQNFLAMLRIETTSS